jgi:hypothetical protein
MTEKFDIEITIPAAHVAYAKSWWIDQMIIWCLSNGIDYKLNQWPRANEEHGWTSRWLFNNSEDAVLFALRWKQNDWGLPHFPV